jgi:malate/lactate dehydrogenase
MVRSDLLTKNCSIFKVQREALSNLSRNTVKCLIAGNPATPNAFICSKYATTLGPANFSAMTRRDHNRFIGEIAAKFKVTPDKVLNTIIWGNHSNTQVPDRSQATVALPDGTAKVIDKLPVGYFQTKFVQKISTRGGAVIKAHGSSLAATATHCSKRKTLATTRNKHAKTKHLEDFTSS